jgi:hypothetical protein
MQMGNVLRVDAVYGNDATAYIGGLPYATVEAALAAIPGPGYTIWVLPGTYDINRAGITIPDGTALRGVSLQTCTIRIQTATEDATLLTMGENCRVEDLTLKLQSDEHHTLKGIVFGGTSNVTSKLRTCVVTVDNAGAPTEGTSNVYGIECNGTGTLGAASFSFNCIKGSTINVYSNGGGDKRGILVSGTNIVTTRDTNIYVAAPGDPASTGSYVGVETNNGLTGSIQLRSTTVGTVTPGGEDSYTASDILQTTPSTITNPTYLASPGIQLGPGVDLVTKTAGGKAFSSYVYPTIIYYGLKGNLTTGGSPGGAYMWPGTQAATNNSFPDPTIPAAYFRSQQPFILAGIAATLGTAPGTGNTTTITIRRTPAGGSITNVTGYSLVFGATDTDKAYYDTTQTFGAGDRIHVLISYTGGNGNNTSDVTVQLDCF